MACTLYALCPQREYARDQKSQKKQKKGAERQKPEWNHQKYHSLERGHPDKESRTKKS